MQHRRREIHRVCRAAEFDRHALAHFHALQLLEEVDVEIGAAELAVGDALEAPAFLGAHDLADRGVFDRAE